MPPAFRSLIGAATIATRTTVPAAAAPGQRQPRERRSAHAHRAGNPDRPAPRHAHPTGAIGASPRQSRRVGRTKNKSDRGKSAASRLSSVAGFVREQKRTVPDSEEARVLPLSDRPGTLLCPALLRTGLAPFNASGSSKSRRSAGLSPYDPIPVGGARRPRVHSPRPLVAASSLSVGWGLVVIVVFGAHLTTSARFRARAPGPVSGRLSETVSWRGRPSCLGFPLRFRRRHWLLGHPVPARGLGVPHGRLTGSP